MSTNSSGGGIDLFLSQLSSARRKSWILLPRPVQQFACIVTTFVMSLLFCKIKILRINTRQFNSELHNSEASPKNVDREIM
jgi:hypothetical protein